MSELAPRPAEAEPPDRPDRPNRVPRWLEVGAQVGFRFLVVIAALAVAGFVFLRLRLVFLPAFVALLAATLLVPPVRWLRNRGWKPLLATWTVLLGAVLLLAGIVALIVPQVQGQFTDLGDQVEEGLQEIEDWLNDELGISDADIDRYLDQAGEQAGGDNVGSRVASSAVVVGEIIAGVLLAIVMTFFFTKDGDRICAWALGHTPSALHDRTKRAARRAWDVLSAYIRGTAIVGLVDATIIGIGLAVIGVPLVLPLSIITFFGAFFPLVGATVAGILAALVALVTGGVVDALLVIAVVVIVQQVEGDVLAPIVMGRALKLHPLVILVALTAGGVLAGILGAFLAVPFTAVAVGVTAELRSEPSVQEAGPDP